MKRLSTKKDALFNRASKAWDSGDTATAFNHFHEAAELGDPSSQVNLGYFYDEGIHVQKDLVKALYWYKKAFYKDSCAAAHNIALIFKSERRYRKALWWLHRATHLLDHDAYYEIAKFYEKGLGVKKNKKRALYYYQKVLDSEYVTETFRRTISKSYK